jgi:Chlorophyll A-B binding protein
LGSPPCLARAGGPVFNFAGLAKEGGDATKTMRTKELKNGRLAMIAMLGFAAQAVMTGKGPIANLGDHISHPFADNLLANLGKLGGN